MERVNASTSEAYQLFGIYRQVYETCRHHSIPYLLPPLPPPDRHVDIYMNVKMYTQPDIHAAFAPPDIVAAPHIDDFNWLNSIFSPVTLGNSAYDPCRKNQQSSPNESEPN